MTKGWPERTPKLQAAEADWTNVEVSLAAGLISSRAATRIATRMLNALNDAMPPLPDLEDELEQEAP